MDLQRSIQLDNPTHCRRDFYDLGVESFGGCEAATSDAVHSESHESDL